MSRPEYLLAAWAALVEAELTLVEELPNPAFSDEIERFVGNTDAVRQHAFVV